MRLLLDTHALLWWLLDDPRLSRPAVAAIDSPDSRALVSAVSVFEIATKHRLGKLPLPLAMAADIAGAVEEQGFETLPLDPRTAEQAGRLPGPHRDPFDRLLIAQAMGGDLVLISNEVAFDRYGVRRLW